MILFQRKQKAKLAILLIIVLVIGCFSVPLPGMRAYAAAKLKVSSAKSVAVNCSIQIKANMSVKFKSSDNKIATVNAKGVVKGKKAGKVHITVTSKKNKRQKKVITITVKQQLVITSPKQLKATLYVGENAQIKANLPSKYKSSNTSVATVNGSGKIVAKKAGKANITVTAKNNKRLKKTVAVTVKSKTVLSTSTVIVSKDKDKVIVSGNVVYAESGISIDEVLANLKTEKGAVVTNKGNAIILVTAEDASITKEYSLVYVPRKESPAVTIDYTNVSTREIITDKMEYTFDEQGFSDTADIKRGMNKTVSVEGKKQIWIRYIGEGEVFAPKEQKIEIKYMELENILYYPYPGAKGYSYAFFEYNEYHVISDHKIANTIELLLSDIEITDFSAISPSKIKSFTYSDTEPYYHDGHDYLFVYVRYAKTDSALASDWVRATEAKVDNEFDFDDIP